MLSNRAEMIAILRSIYFTGLKSCNHEEETEWEFEGKQVPITIEEAMRQIEELLK